MSAACWNARVSPKLGSGLRAARVTVGSARLRARPTAPATATPNTPEIEQPDASRQRRARASERWTAGFDSILPPIEVGVARREPPSDRSPGAAVGCRLRPNNRQRSSTKAIHIDRAVPPATIPLRCRSCAVRMAMGRTVSRLEIRGLVQGVGCRWAMVEQARRLGLCGWVRNRRDGSVEAMLAGPTDAVEQMVGCRALAAVQAWGWSGTRLCPKPSGQVQSRP